MCAPISELPSNISTMLSEAHSIDYRQANPLNIFPAKTIISIRKETFGANRRFNLLLHGLSIYFSSLVLTAYLS